MVSGADRNPNYLCHFADPASDGPRLHNPGLTLKRTQKGPLLCRSDRNPPHVLPTTETIRFSRVENRGDKFFMREPATTPVAPYDMYWMDSADCELQGRALYAKTEEELWALEMQRHRCWNDYPALYAKCSTKTAVGATLFSAGAKRSIPEEIGATEVTPSTS